jgi:hypothetical protein
MRLPPRIERARDDIAPKPSPDNGSIHFVVIQQALTNNEKIVIAALTMVAARAAPEQDDRARVEVVNETTHRLGESGIEYRPALHTVSYIQARRKIHHFFVADRALAVRL